MTSYTEQEIIAGCKKQDPRFQKELVLRYSGLLLTVARRYTRDVAFAKDVLQESLLKILRALPNYEDRGNLVAWMKRIVINTALKYFNKSSFKNEILNLEHVADTAVNPDVYAQLDAEELMKVINCLPDGFREVFNLNVVEGYSHKEIAEALQIKESTSRSQLTRAKVLLRKYLTQNEEKIRIRI